MFSRLAAASRAMRLSCLVHFRPGLVSFSLTPPAWMADKGIRSAKLENHYFHIMEMVSIKRFSTAGEKL
jgi:hypothetical protein